MCILRGSSQNRIIFGWGRRREHLHSYDIGSMASMVICRILLWTWLVPLGDVVPWLQVAEMNRPTIALLAVMVASSAHAQAVDPTEGYHRMFGLGGHACRQEDDQGRMILWTEGSPSSAVVSWLQRSADGTRANVAMPRELEEALASIPPCLLGRHHS